MTTKKTRKRLALSALVFATRVFATLVFAALAAGTLLFSTLTGCEQAASSSPTRKSQLTVNDTPAGVYVASIYKPMDGLPNVNSTDWDSYKWVNATAISRLAASGVVRTDGGKAVIPLEDTLTGGDFTGSGSFLAVISPASPHDTPQYKHYSITDFTAGRAAVSWERGTHMSYVHTITFHIVGSPDFYLEVPLNGKVLEPKLKPEQMQAGYELDGWYTDADYTEKYDFDDKITGNLDLYARWLPSDSLHTVTFDLNYEGATGAPQPQSIQDGSTITPPDTDPTREGWGFIAWVTKDAEGTETKYDFDTLVTEDITLYAKWTNVFYTVTFKRNDGTDEVYITQSIQDGSTITPPDTDPKRTGWGFGGWVTKDAEGTETAWDFDTPVTEDITLYATWTKRSYTVTFKLNYGSDGVYSTKSVEYGESVDAPATAPTREGNYVFDDWYTAASGGKKYIFGNPVTADLMLYAHWTKYPVVSFYVDGELKKEVAVPPGGKVTEPTDITKTGYVLDGCWYTSPYYTEPKYDFNTEVNGDFNLYAKWWLDSFAGAITVMNADKGKTDKTYLYYLKSVSGNGLPETYNTTLTLTTENSPASVTINGSGRVVAGNGNSITVGADVTLTLSNITFKDILFTVADGGKLVLGDNVTINKTNGNGVEVTGGTLEMNSGASINGNNGTGVGVIVSAGLFNMKGGTISANMGNAGQYQYGGGVRVNGTNAKFNMRGGLISGNTAPAYNPYYSYPGDQANAGKAWLL